jgi:hypothetical protein
VTLSINGIEHTFPASKPLKKVPQPWYEMASKEYELPHEHASLINMAISNLEKDFAKGMEKSYEMVTDHVTSEELYKVIQERVELKEKISRILQIEESIKVAQSKKTRTMMKFMTGLCFIQLTVGYYAIFEVEWLGWDLFEPLTYTFG